MKKFLFVLAFTALTFNLVAGNIDDASNAADKLEYRVKYYGRDGITVVKTQIYKSCRWAYNDVMEADSKKYSRICIEPMYDISTMIHPECNKCYPDFI